MNTRQRPYADLPFRSFAYVMSFLAGLGSIIALNVVLILSIHFLVTMGIGQYGNPHLIIVLVVELFILQQSYFVAKEQFYSTMGTYQKHEWDCLKPDTPIEDVEAIFFTACSTLIEKCYSKEEIVDMINTNYQ